MASLPGVRLLGPIDRPARPQRLRDRRQPADPGNQNYNPVKAVVIDPATGSLLAAEEIGPSRAASVLDQLNIQGPEKIAASRADSYGRSELDPGSADWTRVLASPPLTRRLAARMPHASRGSVAHRFDAADRVPMAVGCPSSPAVRRRRPASVDNHGQADGCWPGGPGQAARRRPLVRQSAAEARSRERDLRRVRRCLGPDRGRAGGRLQLLGRGAGPGAIRRDHADRAGDDDTHRCLPAAGRPGPAADPRRRP